MHIHLFRINIPIDQSEFHSDLRGNPAFVASFCIYLKLQQYSAHCDEVFSRKGSNPVTVIQPAMTAWNDLLICCWYQKQKSRKVEKLYIQGSTNHHLWLRYAQSTQSIEQFFQWRWKTHSLKHWNMISKFEYQCCYHLIHTLRWSSLPNYSTTVVFTRVGLEIRMFSNLP